jgi:hypothetical protein
LTAAAAAGAVGYDSGMMRARAASLAGYTMGALLCVAATASASPARPAEPRAAASLASAETGFLDFLDAHGVTTYLESGGAARFRGADIDAWRAARVAARGRLDAALAAVDEPRLTPADAKALAALRASLAALDSSGAEDAGTRCADAGRPGLGFAALRSALVDCFVEHGNQLRFRDGTVDRGTALQLLHLVPDATERKALFDAFGPLWQAVNGRNEPDSAYRRLVAQAALAARTQPQGSNVDVAARALGVTTDRVEQWLVQLLEAWRDANPGEPIEPWDFRYVHGAAGRDLDARIGVDTLVPVNERFYRDLGADLVALGVVHDLQPRPDKSPVAYADFLVRGREVAGAWQRPVARVLGTYVTGGLFSLNELVHENGHAVHVSAIRARPAYMDWPDSLFVEAFADVPSWSTFEPAWQQKYLGAAVDEAASLRALYSNVMLDVAWSLFELRLLRDPSLDPNALWTSITSEYLRIRPHPDVPWWAMRVQLVGDPGYMVNYGLGAILTAAMRARTAAAIGPFDTGNPRWYPWLEANLLRFGSELDTATLMHDFLDREPSPDALLAELRRMDRMDKSR